MIMNATAVNVEYLASLTSLDSEFRKKTTAVPNAALRIAIPNRPLTDMLWKSTALRILFLNGFLLNPMILRRWLARFGFQKISNYKY